MSARQWSLLGRHATSVLGARMSVRRRPGVVATSLSVIVDVVAVGTTGSVSPQATTAIIDNSNSRSLAAGLVMSAPLAN